MITRTCVEFQDRGVTSRLWLGIIRYMSVYVLILIMAWGLKYHYSHAGSEDLLWILTPTAGIVSAISGMDFKREADSGYMSQDRRVLIAPACAGINFFIIAFSMASFYVVHRLDHFKMRLLWIGIIGVGAYGFTLMVNAIRIILSLILLDVDMYHGWLTITRVHRIEGIMVYFIFLCLFFQVIRYTTGRVPGLSGQDLKTRGLKDSKKIPSNRPRRRSGRIPSHLIPFVWYAAVMLLVPVINGAYRADPKAFSEHAVNILAAGLIIPLVFSGIRVCYEYFARVFGIKNPGRIGRGFHRINGG